MFLRGGAGAAVLTNQQSGTDLDRSGCVGAWAATVNDSECNSTQHFHSNSLPYEQQNDLLSDPSEEDGRNLRSHRL